MMNDFIVNVEKTTRMVTLTKSTIGNDFENLQEKHSKIKKNKLL